MAIVLDWAHDVLALHGETLSTKYLSINLQALSQVNSNILLTLNSLQYST